MFENETRTETMLQQASMLSTPESKGELALPPESTSPSPRAVFAEPIVTAQPCRIKRDIPAFMQRMKALAQMAGEEYRYSFPVKNKDGSKKFIEGGSIKMANDLAREYGNCMVDVRVVDEGGYYVFYARFVDYETGFCFTRALRQRKGQKTINTDAERQEDIVFQIGQSKAIRNVVLNALQTFADFTYEEAKNSLVVQIGKQLDEWRTKMQRGIADKNYDLKRIEASVGKVIGEWLAQDIARVLAELKSIKDGMASFDDIYPDPTKAQANNAAALNEEFLGKEAAKEPEKKPEPQKPVDAAVASAAAALNEEPKAKEEVKPFDISTYRLDTQTGTKEAVKDLVAFLEKADKEQRPGLFVALGGQQIIDVLGRHGIGSLKNRFTEIGVNLVPEAQGTMV